jgi:hypothetical protein
MPKSFLLMITPLEGFDPDDLEWDEDDEDSPDPELLATCFEGIAQMIRRTGK